VTELGGLVAVADTAHDTIPLPEVAQLLGCRYAGAYGLVARGILPLEPSSTRAGFRISRSVVEDYIERKRSAYESRFSDLGSHLSVTLNAPYRVLIDHCDRSLFEICSWTGSRNSSGRHYVSGSSRSRKLRQTMMHRVIVQRVVDRSLLAHEEVDHINGDGLDNRRSNLRIATRAINMQNRRGHDSRNKTGYRGVVRARSGRYVAQATQNKRHIYLGTFPTPQLAYEAVRGWRIDNMPGYVPEYS